jgi:tetratricopeptide (TPR) repeat protein
MLGSKPDILTNEHADLLAASRLLVDRGDSSSARTILEALIRADNAHTAFEARKSLSLIHKRHDRWQDAIQIWEAMLLQNPDNFFAVEEMAKYLEHRRRDFKKAIDIISEALRPSHFRAALEKEALVYRLRRLKSRAGCPNNE